MNPSPSSPQVIHAARHEMARIVEGVLARRDCTLFLNARAALTMASDMALLLAAELGYNMAWRERQVAAFTSVADGCPRPLTSSGKA